MPDVAGGLAFMYNLTGQDGQRITNLNINAQVADGIFLGEITNWDDPAIANINPQLAGDLPNTTIIPVYRSDASGENYLLSDYMLHEDGANFVAAQNAFVAPNPGQPTAIWPVPGDGRTRTHGTYPGWGAGIRWARTAPTTPPTTCPPCPATGPSPTSRRPTPRSTASRWPVS